MSFFATLAVGAILTRCCFPGGPFLRPCCWRAELDARRIAISRTRQKGVIHHAGQTGWRKPRDVPIQIRQIDSVEPVAVIAVKAQISGELNQVFFKEGEEVKKGQEVRDRSSALQQALDQAQAALQKDIALVTQADANLARDRAQAVNAREQAKRYAGLAAEGMISKDQNDLLDHFPGPRRIRSSRPGRNQQRQSLLVADRSALRPRSSIFRIAISGRQSTAAPVVIAPSGQPGESERYNGLGEHQSIAAGLRYLQRSRELLPEISVIVPGTLTRHGTGLPMAQIAPSPPPGR